MATWTRPFTAIIDFDGTIEEIDVRAENLFQARILVAHELREDYAPGGKILRVEEAINGILVSYG